MVSFFPARAETYTYGSPQLMQMVRSNNLNSLSGGRGLSFYSGLLSSRFLTLQFVSLLIIENKYYNGCI